MVEASLSGYGAPRPRGAETIAKGPPGGQPARRRAIGPVADPVFSRIWDLGLGPFAQKARAW